MKRIRRHGHDFASWSQPHGQEETQAEAIGPGKCRDGVSTRTDPGLFGPDSVTWKVHADPAMALGGLRALLLQAVHPLAMAGVAQHSGYRSDPWGRLFRTAEYVGAVTYGTTAEAQRAAARVRGVHRRLSGVEPESRLAYRVDDPALLCWVHCAEADSFLAAYRSCGGRLGRGEADAYLGEQVRAAALVGIDPATVPATEAALSAYFRAIRPQLRVTADARQALWFILTPPMPCRRVPRGRRSRRWPSACCPAGHGGFTALRAC
jgi:uncharacterized protein (DUF2236 family)